MKPELVAQSGVLHRLELLRRAQERSTSFGLEVCGLWFFESGFNPVMQIFNPNPLRIRYQHDASNPILVWLCINISQANKKFRFSANTKSKSDPVPVSCEISDFTQCAYARNNIPHIKYGEKTDD